MAMCACGAFSRKIATSSFETLTNFYSSFNPLVEKRCLGPGHLNGGPVIANAPHAYNTRFSPIGTFLSDKNPEPLAAQGVFF